MQDAYLFSAAALALGWLVFFTIAYRRIVSWAVLLGQTMLISLVLQVALFLAGSQNHAFTVLLAESTLALVGRDSDGE